jgi:hypothetical protein
MPQNFHHVQKNIKIPKLTSFFEILKAMYISQLQIILSMTLGKPITEK